MGGVEKMASPELIEEARELHARSCGDDIEVDEEALISRSDDGTWVAGWLWVADSDLCPHGECRGDCTECANRKTGDPLGLTAQDWMTIVDGLKAKLKSATVAGSDRESRAWRAHLRAIKQAIIDGEHASLNEQDWAEVFYALDYAGGEYLAEKIGPDGKNMVV